MEDWNELTAGTRLAFVRIGDHVFRPGDRVRLQPRGGADIFDTVLAGKTATIEAIEQDYEDRIHFAVTVDDDPGRDLGWERKPAHRFFFAPAEVELIGDGSER